MTKSKIHDAEHCDEECCKVEREIKRKEAESKKILAEVVHEVQTIDSDTKLIEISGRALNRAEKSLDTAKRETEKRVKK